MSNRSDSTESGPPRPQVVVRWTDTRLRRMWTLGYEQNGAFHAWAGGSSEDALQALIRSELNRSPRAEVTDRREYVPKRAW